MTLEEITKYNIAWNKAHPNDQIHFWKESQVKDHQVQVAKLKQSQAIYDSDSEPAEDDVREYYIRSGKRPETIQDQARIDNFDENAKSTTKLGLGVLGTGALMSVGAGAFGAVPADIVNGLFAVNAMRNLASNNGITKTIRLFNQGDYYGGAKSALGDALDLGLSYSALKTLGRIGTSVKNGATLGNAYRSDVVGRSFLNNTKQNLSNLAKYDLLQNQIRLELTDPNKLVHVSPNLITETRFAENANAAKMGFGQEVLAAHSNNINWVPGKSPNSEVNGANKVWLFKGKPYRVTPRDNTYIQIDKQFLPNVTGTFQEGSFAADYIPLTKASKILQRNPVTGWYDRVIVETPKLQKSGNATYVMTEPSVIQTSFGISKQKPRVLNYESPTTNVVSFNTKDPFLSIGDYISQLNDLKSKNSLLDWESKYLRLPIREPYYFNNRKIKQINDKLDIAKSELDPIVNSGELKQLFINKDYFKIYNFLKESNSPVLWEVRKEFWDNFNLYQNTMSKSEAIKKAGEEMRADLLKLYGYNLDIN